MASSTNIHFIFVLITFLIILRTSLSYEHISTVDGILPFSPKHVVVTNKLVAQFGLLVHCTSQETDLGVISVLIGQVLISDFVLIFLKQRNLVAFSRGLELLGRLISLGSIGTIVQQVSVEYAVNVFGTYRSQVHVVLDVMEALLAVFHGLLNHIKIFILYFFHMKENKLFHIYNK